jgi:hypothetical protein
MIPSIEEMINQYIAAWNETGLDAFNAAFDKCWAADATYTDPNFALIKGVDGIAGLAHSSREKVPSRTFFILALPDYHHNSGCYTWKVDLPGGIREGFDYFEFNEEHKLTRVVGFFGPLK